MRTREETQGRCIAVLSSKNWKSEVQVVSEMGSGSNGNLYIADILQQMAREGRIMTERGPDTKSDAEYGTSILRNLLYKLPSVE
jgi:hypothetical protein